jgi:hypothetical protein
MQEAIEKLGEEMDSRIQSGSKVYPTSCSFTPITNGYKGLIIL